MSKIPLKTRKSIKTALDSADPLVKKASTALGKELTFDDNSAELFEKLQASGKSEDWLFTLGNVLLTYIEQFSKTLTEFCKDPANKEQLEVELTTGKFGVLLVDTHDDYWRLDDGSLRMVTTTSNFGNYLNYYESERLAKILGTGDSMPLNARKNLAAADKEIKKHIQVANKAFGKELLWIDNFQEIYDALKASGKQIDFLFTFGNALKDYAQQFSKTLVEFCKNSDNKDQLESELSTGKVGLRFSTAETETYWSIEDGTLWMDAKTSFYGNYLNYYDVERLCKILGKNDSMPLNTRKSLKAAQVLIDKALAAASKAFGKELTFIDNYQTIYDELKKSNKNQDYLFTIGDPIKDYANQLSKTIIEFCKNTDNKEQLEVELTTGKIGILFYEADGDRYWSIEDGTLWMGTKPNYFGNYLNYYDVERLCKILGKNDSMPLNTRKSLKAAQVLIDKSLVNASKAFGKQLTFVDNYQTIYDELKKSNKPEDYLFTIGDPVKDYAKQLEKIFIDFNKNTDNKEQLETELTTGKVGILFYESEGPERYWIIEDGTLWMGTKPNYFGNYLNYYDVERLCKILGKNDSMPLNTRKSLKVANEKITKFLNDTNKLYGQTLTWIDNYQEIYDVLKKASKPEDYLFTIGDPIAEYAKQLLNAFTKFCKDKDNVEALQEVLTSGKVGIRFTEKTTDEYWAIDDGTLWMETKPNYFGNYLNYYDSERLEKKL